MRPTDGQTDLHEVESLVYRLFAEKQFAVALLALVMVAQLATAQFLLLRMASTTGQTTSAPDGALRLDVVCGPDGMTGLQGEQVDPMLFAGREVVVHVPPRVATCIEEVGSAPGLSSMVVGLPVGDAP
jgi:hypothetical protein